MRRAIQRTGRFLAYFIAGELRHAADLVDPDGRAANVLRQQATLIDLGAVIREQKKLSPSRGRSVADQMRAVANGLDKLSPSGVLDRLSVAWDVTEDLGEGLQESD